MKNVMILLVVFVTLTMTSCGPPSSNQVMKQKTEEAMIEATKQIGMPGIINFQEKKNLKWIYELCDQENFICHAYLCNELNGEIGQYLGKCVGYGVPYSTQYSTPEVYYGNGATISQAEPNGLFKPDGMSATWLIMIDPETKQPRPIYVEPSIIVSPFKLH